MTLKNQPGRRSVVAAGGWTMGAVMTAVAAPGAAASGGTGNCSQSNVEITQFSIFSNNISFNAGSNCSGEGCQQAACNFTLELNQYGNPTPVWSYSYVSAPGSENQSFFEAVPGGVPDGCYTLTSNQQFGPFVRTNFIVTGGSIDFSQNVTGCPACYDSGITLDDVILSGTNSVLQTSQPPCAGTYTLQPLNAGTPTGTPLTVNTANGQQPTFANVPAGCYAVTGSAFDGTTYYYRFDGTAWNVSDNTCTVCINTVNVPADILSITGSGAGAQINLAAPLCDDGSITVYTPLGTTATANTFAAEELISLASLGGSVVPGCFTFSGGPLSASFQATLDSSGNWTVGAAGSSCPACDNDVTVASIQTTPIATGQQTIPVTLSGPACAGSFEMRNDLFQVAADGTGFNSYQSNTVDVNFNQGTDADCYRLRSSILAADEFWIHMTDGTWRPANFSVPGDANVCSEVRP